jgi:hypothetical protein
MCKWLRCSASSGRVGVFIRICLNDYPTFLMKPDVTESHEFEQRRNALLQLLDSSACPVDFARLQAVLAAEIIESERLKAQQRKNKRLQVELKRHLHLCHHLGDGLAWRLLEPHTIRQLAKGEGSPPWLSNQLYATNQALETVSGVAKELNRSAVMADLTNVLRVGDVIVPNGSQCPLIFEFKSSRAGPIKAGYANRASRQLLRMQLTTEYLINDCGTVFGTGAGIRAHTLQHSPEYSYQYVEEACAAALENGFSMYPVDDHDVLFCVRHDQDLGAWLATTTVPPFMRFAALGSHCRYLQEDVHPLLRPSPEWPISLNLRMALLNCDLRLAHLVDPTAIVGSEDSGWVVKSFEQQSEGYWIHRGEQRVLASHQWLNRWLYGFERSSSMAKAMVASVRQLVETYPDADFTNRYGHVAS